MLLFHQVVLPLEVRIGVATAGDVASNGGADTAGGGALQNKCMAQTTNCLLFVTLATCLALHTTGSNLDSSEFVLNVEQFASK